MLSYDIDDADSVELLGALPTSPAMTRAHLLRCVRRVGQRRRSTGVVEPTDAGPGEEGASKAVAQVITSMGGNRVLALMKAAGREARCGDWTIRRADEEPLGASGAAVGAGRGTLFWPTSGRSIAGRSGFPSVRW